MQWKSQAKAHDLILGSLRIVEETMEMMELILMNIVYEDRVKRAEKIAQRRTDSRPRRRMSSFRSLLTLLAGV
jgi:hypothetical protein